MLFSYHLLYFCTALSLIIMLSSHYHHHKSKTFSQLTQCPFTGTLLLFHLSLIVANACQKFTVFSPFCLAVKKYVRFSYKVLLVLNSHSFGWLLTPCFHHYSCFIMSTPLGGGHIIFAFSAIQRPASHLVSRHFRQQFLSYLYQIWHAGLLG